LALARRWYWLQMRRATSGVLYAQFESDQFRSEMNLRFLCF
jgi:hypothetical protein